MIIKPRIVRLTCPKGGTGPSVYRAMSIINDRFVAYVYGRDLHVIDLARESMRPILDIENGCNFATAANTLITYDEERGFQRFVLEGDRFILATRFFIAEQPHPWPSDPVMSPSGRYMAFEVPTLPGEKAPRVMLIDALDGRIISTYHYRISARASFVCLDGVELLFLSAPSYMGVLFIDCASGRVLHSFEPTESWDFCHTDYALSPDGSRLLAFGCIWAAPYEARIYDATPWTRNGTPTEKGFPLPLVFRQYEDLEYETVFTPLYTKTTDGNLDVNGAVSLHELHRLDATARQELQDGLSETNLAILDVAFRLEGRSAFLQRRVDPVSGRVCAFSLVAARSTNELHVHALSEHRALLVGETLEYFDGQTLHDVGTLVVPREYYTTAVTSDGSTIVLRELEA